MKERKEDYVHYEIWVVLAFTVVRVAS